MTAPFPIKEPFRTTQFGTILKPALANSFSVHPAVLPGKWLKSFHALYGPPIIFLSLILKERSIPFWIQSFIFQSLPLGSATVILPSFNKWIVSLIASIIDLSDPLLIWSLFSQASFIIFSIVRAYLLFNNLISFKNKDRFSIL